MRHISITVSTIWIRVPVERGTSIHSPTLRGLTHTPGSSSDVLYCWGSCSRSWSSSCSWAAILGYVLYSSSTKQVLKTQFDRFPMLIGVRIDSLPKEEILSDDPRRMFRLTGINMLQGYIYFPSSDRTSLRVIVSHATVSSPTWALTFLGYRQCLCCRRLFLTQW